MGTPQDATPAVLCVDDEPINLRVFEATFGARFRIVSRQSGPDALEVLAQRAPEIAVLVSDHRMPGMSGVELLEKARELAPDARRILITAFTDVNAVTDAVNRGQVMRYFVKPWSKEEMGAALADAVGIFELQSKLREIQARMFESERLAALGQVSAGIAHELMNPVSYVTQNVVALRREFEALRRFVLQQGPPDEVRKSLEELPSILDDVETGARHIREVALAVRAQARGEDPDSISRVHEVADFAVKIARADVRSRARIQVRGDPVSVRLGPVHLCQVLINLLLNAAHALQDDGRQALIEIAWWAENGSVRIEVRDTGRGIPPELLPRVFEPLFTTKPVGSGTGLGLSICKSIVEGAGGSIRIRSALGAGTTVELTVPEAVE